MGPHDRSWRRGWTNCSFLVAAAASANKIKNRNQQRVKGKVQRTQSVGPDKVAPFAVTAPFGERTRSSGPPCPPLFNHPAPELRVSAKSMPPHRPFSELQSPTPNHACRMCPPAVLHSEGGCRAGECHGCLLSIEREREPAHHQFWQFNVRRQSRRFEAVLLGFRVTEIRSLSALG